MQNKPNYNDKYFNIASYLPYMASQMPYSKAIIYPFSRDKYNRVAYVHLTYSQLEEDSNKIASGLLKYGIKKGTKTLLMVKPSLEFISITFALFKIGAIPILIDPGMGIINVLKCISSVEPEAVIAIPIVHLAKTFFKKYFKNVKKNVIVGNKFLLKGVTLDYIKKIGDSYFEIPKTLGTDPAAILFTSGSTGPAKGVLYEHKMFGAQVELLKTAYNFSYGEVDLSSFPLFALFDIALGMTCCIPDMDPTKPANVNPIKIIEAINNQKVTTSFGSPALWNKVANYCIQNNIKLNSLKRVLIAGAPVSGNLVKLVKQILNNDADVYTPYGATEALPLCNISGNEILNFGFEKTKKGAGILVGKPISPNNIKIIKITNEPIPTLDKAEILKTNEIGEIIVCGPTVTKEYYNNQKATINSKIKDENNNIWHRMGDVGYIDDNGNLWFCGRKDHAVFLNNGKVYYSIKCEAIFNNHPYVFRSALAKKGTDLNCKPVIFIEPKPQHFPKNNFEKEKFINELLELAKSSPETSDIDEFYFIKQLPVDIRHNAKIIREKLSQMVTEGHFESTSNWWWRIFR